MIIQKDEESANISSMSPSGSDEQEFKEGKNVLTFLFF